MRFIIDTHALHWFLEENKKLSSNAQTRINSASIIYIPSIVLLEAYFVAKKKNQLMIFKDFLETLPNDKFTVFPLDLEIIKTTVKLTASLEIHDLIIVATAIFLDVPIVTKDKEIAKIYKKTIW